MSSPDDVRGDDGNAPAFYDVDLFAAAPELYEALAAIVRAGRLGIDAFDISRAEAALAKARGES